MIHQVEILEDILSRLPTKSIGRFRCVSKPWKSLLCKPQFIKTHLNRTKQFPREERSIILISDDSPYLYSVQLKNAQHVSNELIALPIRLNFDGHRFSSHTIRGTVASCDGLILVKDEDDKLLLVNPTTREIKKLPTTPYVSETRINYTMYGLGYDSLTDDYKVVSLAVSEVFDSDDISVSVYSVKNDTWTRVDNSPYSHNFSGDTTGVLVDGRIHWLACTTSGESVIVAFDLEKEEFLKVPTPTWVDCERHMYGDLVMLEGCLSLYFPSTACKYVISLMKEYNVEESWTKFTIADSKELAFSILCSLGKEQLLLINAFAGNLVRYNVKEETFKDILFQGFIAGEIHVLGTFIESLVSPHYFCSNEAVNKE